MIKPRLSSRGFFCLRLGRDKQEKVYANSRPDHRKAVATTASLLGAPADNVTNMPVPKGRRGRSRPVRRQRPQPVTNEGLFMI